MSSRITRLVKARLGGSDPTLSVMDYPVGVKMKQLSEGALEQGTTCNYLQF